MTYQDAQELFLALHFQLNWDGGGDIPARLKQELQSHPGWEYTQLDLYHERPQPALDSEKFNLSATLRRGDFGIELSIMADSYRPKSQALKLEVRPYVPKGAYDLTPYWWATGEALISLSKTPERIAKEIVRRVLPGAQEVFLKYASLKAEREEYRSQVEATIERILNGTTIRFKVVRQGDTYHYTTAQQDLIEIGDQYYPAEVYPGSVNLRLTVTPVQANAILKVLA